MNYWEKFTTRTPVDISRIKGYDDNELEKIERLYNIRLTGEFREFMSLMGKCEGGLIGDDPIILYRPAWGVRTQVLNQVSFFDSMQDSGHFDFLNQPFVFSIESETQYYFIQTKDNDELVYHYDENTGSVNCTDKTFLEYMARVATFSNTNIICEGNLIEI